MTDNDIKKVLECCINDDCDNCPNTFGNCEHNAMQDALDLINRQKAEIERLKGSVITNNIMETQRIKREAKLEVINEFEKEIKYVKENEKYDDYIPIIDIDLCENVLNIMKLQQVIIDTLRTLNKSVASEAIKEVEKRLKSKLQWDVEFDSKIVFENDIDNLIKEMEGSE